MPYAFDLAPPRVRWGEAYLALLTAGLELPQYLGHQLFRRQLLLDEALLVREVNHGLKHLRLAAIP